MAGEGEGDLLAGRAGGVRLKNNISLAENLHCYYEYSKLSYSGEPFVIARYFTDMLLFCVSPVFFENLVSKYFRFQFACVILCIAAC